MDWSTWVQGVGQTVIGAAADAKFRYPYEIQKLQLQALGDSGYYTEGMPTTQGGGIGGISPSVLLIGGALLVAVLLLKD